jgi:hypothetical protein
MVSQDAESRVLSDQITAAVRISAVTDGVTETDQLINPSHRKAVKDCFERL